MPNSQGWFVWHELATTDPAGARSFYTVVAPWAVRPSEMSDTYTLIEAGGTPMGGIVAVDTTHGERQGKPHWTPYVYVYDLDSSVRQVVQLGGQVRAGPEEVPGVGCWALIADPQGVTIGLYEPNRPSATPPAASPPGDFCWHELVTTDYTAAFQFYRALFHWEKTSEFDMGPMGIYFMFGQRGRAYGGIYNRRPDGPAPRWLSYVGVADVNPAAAAVKRLGGAVTSGPMEVPTGDWIAMATDPQGAAFALQSPKPAASAA